MWSDSTIRSTFLVLRKALDTAVPDGKIAKNPARLLSAPKVGRRQVVSLSEEQVASLLRRLSQSRYYPAFALIATTGIRRGEGLGLEWRMVDLEQGVAKVEQTLGQTSGGVRLSDVKTKTSRRRVLFAEEIWDLLREWRKKQVAERLAGGARWNDGAWAEHDFVFTTESGEPVHPRNFLRELQKAVDELGLPKGVGVHTLRHSLATMWLEHGYHVKQVSDSLGHSSSQITLDVYGHTSDKGRAEAAKMATALLGVRPAGEMEEVTNVVRMAR